MDNKLRLIICKNSDMLRKKRIGFTKFLVNQFGGSDRKLTIKYNNNKYIFEEAHDKDYYVLFSKDNFECVSVLIQKIDKTAEIHGIGNYKSCIKETNTNVGSTLFKITLKMLQKYKEKCDIIKIIITDNSLKKCNNYNIKLGLMLTLITGDTWYGKYGFRPSDEELIKYYENNKRIINKITLKDVNFIKYLKMTKLNKTVIDSAKKFIEKHQSLLLKDYLLKFIKEYDKTCEYFYDFYFTLFNDLGLYDFYQRTFELDI